MVAGTVLLHLIFNGLGKEVWGHTRPLEFATYCRAKWIGQLGNLWCLGIGNSLPIKLVVLLLPVTVSSGGIFRKLFADGLVYAPYDVGLVLQSPSNLKCVIDGANQFMTMFGHTNKKQAALTLKRCVTQLTGTKKRKSCCTMYGGTISRFLISRSSSPFCLLYGAVLGCLPFLFLVRRMPRLRAALRPPSAPSPSSNGLSSSSFSRMDEAVQSPSEVNSLNFLLICPSFLVSRIFTARAAHPVLMLVGDFLASSACFDAFICKPAIAVIPSSTSSSFRMSITKAVSAKSDIRSRKIPFQASCEACMMFATFPSFKQVLASAKKGVRWRMEASHAKTTSKSAGNFVCALKPKDRMTKAMIWFDVPTARRFFLASSTAPRLLESLNTSKEASTNLFIACSFPVAEWQGKGASSKVVGNLTTDSLIFFSKSSTRFNCSACPNWHRSNLPWARHLCCRPVEIHGTLTQKHMYLGVAPSITVANCSQYAGQLKALVFSLATLRATQNHWSKLHLFEQRGCIHWCWAERSPMRNLES